MLHNKCNLAERRMTSTEDVANHLAHYDDGLMGRSVVLVNARLRRYRWVDSMFTSL